MATILELIERLDELDAEYVIFVKPEWHEFSEARLFRLTPDFRAPEEALRQGYEYFIEVDVARQVLEEFRDDPSASALTKCRRLIHYATFDA